MIQTLNDAPAAWQQSKATLDALNETNSTARAQIRRAIEALGIDVVEAVVAEARTVEAEGGLLRRDGERRTLGGVFFALLRPRCTPEQRAFIFYPPIPKSSRPSQPVLAPPSEQGLQIAGVIIQKLVLSAKRRTAIARDVDRVGVPESLAALRSAMAIMKKFGGKKNTGPNKIKPYTAWKDALASAPTTSLSQPDPGPTAYQK